MTSRAFGERTSNDRTLCLVKGYHRESYPPELAYKAGLLNRFAVVLDTYRSNKADSFFDAELFLAIMTAICDTIPHDAISLEMDEGGKISSLAELSAAFLHLDESDREPPYRACLFEGDKLVCVEATEFWVRVGGPPLYHDSLRTASLRPMIAPRTSSGSVSSVSERQRDHSAGVDSGEPHEKSRSSRGGNGY